jgi:hypothetical protein
MASRPISDSEIVGPEIGVVPATVRNRTIEGGEAERPRLMKGAESVIAWRRLDLYGPQGPVDTEENR